MTIALVGQSELKYTADGGLALAWPSGTAAGDTGILVTATSGGRKPATSVPAGWQLIRSNSAGEAIYGKLILTPTDIATELDVNAVICGLIVLSGVAAFGTTSASGGVTLPGAADARLSFGRRQVSTPALTPPTDRVFAADGINPKFSSYKVKKKTHWRTRRYNAWVTIPGVAGFTTVKSSADALMSVTLHAAVLPATDPVSMTPNCLSPADDSTVMVDSSYSFLWSNPTAFANPLWTLHQLQLRAVGSSTWGSVSGGIWYPADPNRTELDTAPSATQTSTVMTSALVGGTTYEWRVRAQYAQSVWSAWSEPAQFSVVAPPAIGTVTVTPGISPVVAWTLSSGTQAYARVTVRDSLNELVYDSALTALALGTLTVPQQEWTNGGTYTATAQVMSANGMASTEVSSAPFAISWVPPTAPAAVAVAAGSPPTVTVTGLTVGRLLRLEWDTSDGADTISGIWAVTAAAMTVPAPLLPFGVATTVAAEQSDAAGLLWSNPVTVTATVFDAKAYLVDEGLGDWLEVIVADDDGLAEAEAILVAYPLSASAPAVVRSDRAGDSGTVTFAARTQAEKQQLRAWLRDRGSFWLRWMPERNVLTGLFEDTPPQHMSRSSSWKEQRIVKSAVQQRTVPLSWVERS